MAHQFQESLNTIHFAWDRSLFKYVLGFTSMGPVLRTKTINPNFAYDFMKQFIKLPNILAEWLTSYIQHPHQLIYFYRFLRLSHCLKDNQIFTPENFNILINHTRLHTIAQAFFQLDEYGLLHQRYFNAFTQYADPFHLGIATTCLAQSQILSTNHLNHILHHPDIFNLSRVLMEMNQRRFLNQARFNILLAHPYLNNMADVLNHLNIYLEETTVNSLIQLDSAILFSNETRHLWFRLPGHVLRRHLDDILATIISDHPLQSLTTLVDEIFRQEFPPFPHAYVANFFRRQLTRNTNQPINPSQSTHSTSVHRSVAESAIRLKLSYAGRYALETTLSQFKQYLQDLIPHHSHAKTAHIGFSRLISPDYAFFDPSSSLSIKQLLALAYVAIHDPEKCQASLDHAKELLLEGLYEIQRGYNIEEGDASEVPDSSICLSGAFNKIIEKLGGIHSDVHIQYVTHGLASIKFPILIRDHLKTYFAKLVQASTVEDYLSAKQILETLKAEGTIEEIWPRIHPKVERSLWDEFHEAYYDNQAHTDFQELIASGIYYATPDLSKIEAALFTSVGHQAWSAANASYGLWSYVQTEQDDENQSLLKTATP